MKSILIIVFLFFIFVINLNATIINVPADTSTIQGAIYLANNGDTVLVADGLYYENVNFKGKAITVSSHYYIDGDTSHISNTIIDGSQPSHPDSGSVVYFISGEDTTSVIYGLTITGGSGTYWPGFDMYGGGGILIESGGKVLHNKITGNHLVTQKWSSGAGIVASSYNMSANIVIEHNDIVFNSIVSPGQTLGGGIHMPLRSWTGGYCRVKNNKISHNSNTCTGQFKAVGGGIMISLNLPTIGDVIIESNIISHNELHCVASFGAGIYVVYWEPGGTVIDNNPSPVIYNNIIADNYSLDKGGSIGIVTVENNHQASSIISPQPAFINNTITNNSAKDGCAIFNYDSYPLLFNNILWDDLSVTGSREIFNDDVYYPGYLDPYNRGEIFVRYSNIQDTLWPGAGNMNIYPQFVAGDSLYRLMCTTDTSRCLNAGVDSMEIIGAMYYAPLFDYTGNPRPQPVGTPPDMGAWESPVVSALEEIQGSKIPNEFTLSQNYPNPFNPITTIEFSIPNIEFVTLKIYNLLGQEVEELVAKRLTPGNYNYSWDASGLASGIYYYRIAIHSDKIEAGNFQKVKKLILLR